MVLPIIGAIAGGAISALGARSASRSLAAGAREAGRIQERAWRRAGDIGEKAAYDAAGIRGDASTEAARLEADGFTRGAQTEADALRTGGDMRGNAADGVVNMLTQLRDQDLARYQPYADTGNNALRAYQYEMGLGERPTDYGGFTATPSYDFRRREGLGAVESSVAGRQGLASGAAMEALDRAAQDYGSLEYDNYLRRLEGLMAQGYSAADAQAMLSQNAGVNIGNVRMSGANARATGLEGAGAAIAGGIRGAAGATAGGVIGRGMASSEGILGAAQSQREGLTQGAGARATAITGGANARASGTVGMANAFGGALEQGVGAWQQNELLKRFGPQAMGGR
jgi:hypothetical protein